MTILNNGKKKHFRFAFKTSNMRSFSSPTESYSDDQIIKLIPLGLRAFICVFISHLILGV